VVLLFDKQVVIGLIDDGDVELLSANEIWLGEGEVISGLEDLDNSAVVQSRCESGEEIGKETWLMVSVRSLR
jgi:hypothetical protein